MSQGKTKKYCLIRGNKFVKRLIRERAQQFKVSLQRICMKQGIDWLKFKNWITCFDPMSFNNTYMSQDEVIRIAEQLGIEIRLELKLHDNLNLDLYKRKSDVLAQEKKELEFKKYKESWENDILQEIASDFTKEEDDLLEADKMNDELI